MYLHLKPSWKTFEFALHRVFAPETNTTPKSANLPKKRTCWDPWGKESIFTQKWGKYLQFNRLSTLPSYQPNSFISADVLHIYQSRNLPCCSLGTLLIFSTFPLPLQWSGGSSSINLHSFKFLLWWMQLHRIFFLKKSNVMVVGH